MGSEVSGLHFQNRNNQLHKIDSNSTVNFDHILISIFRYIPGGISCLSMVIVRVT